MNILYINWMCFGAEDAIEALQDLGHRVFILQLSDASHEKLDWDFVDIVEKAIKKDAIELVFSFNFFPTLSQACVQGGCKYMSFVYDSPSIKVYDPSILNECNYVFTFDGAMYEELRGKGASTVYYAPLPVNTKRLAKLSVTAKEKQYYSCDIAFVGSLYNEKHHLYERLIEKAQDPHLTGYLEGVMEAQLKVHGYNLMSECLTKDIIEAMYQAMPFQVQKGSLTDLQSVYSDYFLCRRLAYLERSRILELLSQDHKVFHYTQQ